VNSMKVTNWSLKCGYLMVFGLCLYLLDIGLHLSLAAKYLTMQGCYRSVSHTFSNFKLDDLVDLENLTANLNSKDQPKIEPSGLSSKLSDFLDDSLYLNLRDEIIRILPQHWVDRVVNIITFQAKKYRGSDIAKMCKLNGNQFSSLAEMGVYVCDQAFHQSSVKEGEATRAAKALTSIFANESTEDALVEALVGFDIRKVMDVLITDILAEGDVKTAKILQSVFARLAETFNAPEDINAIMSLISSPVIQSNLGALMETVATIDPANIDGAAKTFGKIEQENMPEIDRLLGKLNVTLATFIMDPGILFTFFGDPEKAQIMMEVQKLLPLFTPEDIEAVLNVKMAFDGIPDADMIFGKVLALPGHVLQNIFQLNLSQKELKALKTAAQKFISNEDTLSLLDVATNDLDLLSSSGRQTFVSECTHESLIVECIDTSVDLCSQGHYLYGLCTIACAALPGILFALSDFYNYKGFTFGRLLCNPSMRKWPLLIKLLVLPFYILMMIPSVIFVTLFSYIKAILSLIRSYASNSDSTTTFSPNADNEWNEGVTDVRRMKREKEFHAIKLHSLESYAQSFLQIIIQVYFLFLLLLLGTGTVIAGVSAEKFFQDIFPLTVASIFVSLLNFTITAWNLQAKDHIAKDELNHSSANEDNNPVKHFHQNVTSVFTHVVWTLSSIVVYSGSLVFLLLLAYIEMFSNYLMDTGFKVNIHLLPFLIILSNIPVNIILYKIFINNKDSFSLAHAILSPIKPCRYLHYDDINRTRKFMIGNQLTKWLSHVVAWLTYSISIYVNYDSEETGLSRLFPVMAAIVTIPPIFGAIHWAVSIEPSYDGTLVNKNFDNDSVKSLQGQTSKLQIFWQILTFLTRCTSFGLLAYVYYEHWLEVGWSSVRIAVVETVPFVLILVLGNIAIQFMYHLGSILEGFIGIFMPNGYLKAQLQSRHEKSAVLVSSHYIVLNVAWNAILHILLWLVLTFYCWDCTKILSLTKLIYCFPVTIALWLINFILTIYVWKKSIKPILGSANPPHIREHEQSEEDSMGPQSQNWDQSAKTVYSTQL